VASVLDAVGGAPLVIGKSLGSHAAALTAEHGLPAVWLTPLLLDDRWWPRCAGRARRSCRSAAPPTSSPGTAR
jgi:hypothetical protein